MKKNNYIKKVTLLTIALIVFVLGMASPKAEVIVYTAEQLQTQLKDKTVQFIKLGADITTSVDGYYDIQSADIPNKAKYIDLNGYNITETDRNIHFALGNYTDELHILNNSTGNSKISAAWAFNLVTENPSTTRYFKLVINNVDFYKNGSVNPDKPLFQFSPTKDAGDTVTHTIKINNSNLLGGKNLFQFDNNVDNVNFDLNNIRFEANSATSKFYTANHLNITYNDILSGEQVYYVDNNLVSLGGNATVEAEGSIHEIKEKSADFEISPIELVLTYGYTQAEMDAEVNPIRIKNKSSETKTIYKYQLSTYEIYTIEGPEFVTIEPNSTNEDFTIKGNTLGRGAGSNNTTLDLYDGSDLLASANLRWFTAHAKYDLNVTIENWNIWNPANEPVITGIPDEVLLEKTPELEYTGISGTNYGPSNTAPTEEGKYRLKVYVGATSNYLSATKYVDFEVNREGKTIITSVEAKDIEIVYKDSYTIDDFEEYLNIMYKTTPLNSMLVYNVLEIEQPNPNFAGNNTIQITIRLSDVAFNTHAFEGGVQTYTGIFPLKITGITPVLTASPSDITSSETSLALARDIDTSIDLTNRVSIDNDYQTVSYSVDGYGDKVYMDGNTLHVRSDFGGDLIQINASVNEYDLGGDSTPEYKSKSLIIYVKMLEKRILSISGLEDEQKFYYDGSPKTPQGTITVEDNLVPVSELEIRYTGVGNDYHSATAPVNAGKYEVTYRVAATNAGYSGLVVYKFEILPSAPSYTIPTDLVGKVGNTVASVILPSGWTWREPTTTITTAGDFTAEAMYSSGDPNYYEPSMNLTIKAYHYYDVTTIVNGANGTATSKTDIRDGDSYTVVFTPNLGYKIAEVSVNGIATTVTNNELVLTVDEDKEVIVSFEKIKYSVYVDSPLGLTIDKPGTSTVEHGDSFVLTVKTKLGFRLLKLNVNGVDMFADLIADQLTLNNISEAKNITFEVEKIIYEVIEGAKQEVVIKDDAEAEFKIDADFAIFESVYINDVLLDPANYTVSEGSTIITLKDAYLASLKNGTYNMTVVFSDGGNANTTFTIARTSTGGAGITNPSTGDSLYTYIALLIISLLAIIKTSFVIKRKKKEV